MKKAKRKILILKNGSYRIKKTGIACCYGGPTGRN
jgi:hypothetical protein